MNRGSRSWFIFPILINRGFESRFFPDSNELRLWITPSDSRIGALKGVPESVTNLGDSFFFANWIEILMRASFFWFRLIAALNRDSFPWFKWTAVSNHDSVSLFERIAALNCGSFPGRIWIAVLNRDSFESDSRETSENLDHDSFSRFKLIKIQSRLVICGSTQLWKR